MVNSVEELKQCKFEVIQKAPSYHNITLEECLMDDNARSYAINNDPYGTTTLCHKEINDRRIRAFPYNYIYCELERFWAKWSKINDVPRENFYEFWKKRKRSGRGYRELCKVVEGSDLYYALQEMIDMFVRLFNAKKLYHNSAHGYVTGRSTLSCCKVHQKKWMKTGTGSRWFLDIDFSGFFPSTTLDYTMAMLDKVYPFCMVTAHPEGYELLRNIISLCFINGGLPQGTITSPMITNIIMIPFDYYVSNKLRDFSKHNFRYSRYADDCRISCAYHFDPAVVLNFIREVLAGLDMPYEIKDEKTKYHSIEGKNWHLGLMHNKDNCITVGYKKKKEFKAALHNYGKDRLGNNCWSLDDLDHINGLYSHYHSIEPQCFEELVAKTSNKLGIDIMKQLREDIAYIRSGKPLRYF